MKDGGASKIHDELLKKDIEDLPGTHSVYAFRADRWRTHHLCSRKKGMAQFGCIPCSRYFATEVALVTHNRGKPHKRRLKKLEEEPYTIEESQRAAGCGIDNGVAKAKKDVMEGMEEALVIPAGTGVVAFGGGVRGMVESAVGLVGDAMLKLIT